MEQTNKVDLIDEFRPEKKIYVKWVNDNIGWGVFAGEPISKGDVVEVCYCLLDSVYNKTHLDYVFGVEPDRQDVYHVLGYGSIYNHDDNPNIYWRHLDMERRLIVFYASRDIEVNEELRWNYGKKYWEKKERKDKKVLI